MSEAPETVFIDRFVTTKHGVLCAGGNLDTAIDAPACVKYRRADLPAADLAEAEARERDAYARGFKEALEKAAEWFDENKDDYDRLEPCVVASMLRAIPLPDKEGGDT